MQNLFRRSSGIYVLRLVVPTSLRQIFGKREIVVSTGSRELPIAKIFAGLEATQWRQRFIDSTRLLLHADTFQMDHKHILQLVQGSPLLLGSGFLPLEAASTASGIPTSHLLRLAAEGKLQLGYRSAGQSGHLIPLADLNLAIPELGPQGGWVVPLAEQLPNSAVGHVASGTLLIPRIDLAGISAALMETTAPFFVIAFELRESPGNLFVPLGDVSISRKTVEVSAHDVEQIRVELAALTSPDRVRQAKGHQKTALAGVVHRTLPRGHEKLSVALEHYIKNRVVHDVTSAGEINRIRNGCALLIEMEGDVVVSSITATRLRAFLNEKLAQVPANENKVRLIHGTKNVSESIAALRGTEYVIMSSSEREKRMRWIRKWFAWLKAQNEWIDTDPAAPLANERIDSKAVRRAAARTVREDEARSLFTPADLMSIFSAPWYLTGSGTLTRKGTYREFLPYYYWLPLISLFLGGARINEASQLYVDDFEKTEDGTWYVEFNENSEDKKLKNEWSRRVVPIHPFLLNLGLVDWVMKLRDAGHQRLFPELKHDSEKGYGKSATKWFTRFKQSLHLRDGEKKAFHSFRHTFVNALPDEMPDRMRKQMTGHTRGEGAFERAYSKDAPPGDVIPILSKMNFDLPKIAPFDHLAGLQAISDALKRKNNGRGS